MKVRDAIREYLAEKARKNLHPSTVQRARHVLEMIFAPALADDLLVLTAERLTELRSRLSMQASQTTGTPLTEGTRHTYLRVSRAFLAWCASQGWMLAELAAVFDPDGPPALPPKHPAQRLGELVRTLREAAGLTRQQLGERTGLGKPTLQNLEAGRRRPSRWALQLLLNDPAMSTLLEWAKAEGISLELEDEPNGVPRRGTPS